MSDPCAILAPYHPLTERNEMLKVTNQNEIGKSICTLEIVIDGTPYFYEAHSAQKVAEILHNQIETLNALNEKYPQTYGEKSIDTFTIHYFQEVK
jgi:hypothetical protein